jgi:uncharacterized sporulation protein YeaH/YhbH (DUF444 family)
MKDIIRDGNITDITTSKGKKVNIPVKDLSEPQFQHGTGGQHEHVLPGNKRLVPGDRGPRPSGGGSGGEGDGSASPTGEGNDEFTFTLTKDEFIDLFFEDLELPDMFKKNIEKTKEYVNKRAGFTVTGSPSRLNILRSMKQAKARNHALVIPKKRKLKELKKEEALLVAEINIRTLNGEDVSIESERLNVVRSEIEKLERKIKAIPFVDEIDLRYNNWTREVVPTTQAVMFCVMDVSASMGSWEKEMAKRFFMLLYLFLHKSYTTVDIVFIRHHSSAKEVDEEEFFYSKETGGTIVSTALDLSYDIIRDRYPPNAWNIYFCQASDGDNWGEDNAVTYQTLTEKILPITQYFAYVELSKHKKTSDLWPTYEKIKVTCDHIDAVKIQDAASIYPVFRKLFERKS